MFNTKALLAVIAVFTVALVFTAETDYADNLTPVEVAGCCA